VSPSPHFHRSNEVDLWPAQLQSWRESAQRVTRAWNAWLAAEGRDRTARYRALEAAVAAEERAAAELERSAR